MWYREGTITFTQGSNTLVGAGTAWNVTANGVLPGMIVIGPDNKLYEIKRVTSDTNIVLSEPYTGETQSEVPCRIITTYEGDLTQFSARFTALMSRMSADSKSMRSWLTALDEVTIEREDGTEVTVKPLMQIVNEHNENVEWYKNNTDAIDAAGDKAREAAASAAAAAESANIAGEKASQASQSASAAASSQSAASASATAAKKSETNAAASQKSAATSASTATTKASEAATSARDAAASKEAAKSSETSAASSASNAASSATAAGNSAKAAKTSETNARSSETAAGQSASAAAGSKTAAASSASAASTSAGQASASATAAGKSAESAASSASTATTKAGEATEQASAAARSASAAKTSETNAKASETRAESSKTAAASSASSAASSASSASASKDEATRQASAAKGSATTASTKATEAAGSATAASQSKTAAESAATRAEAAADRAEEIAGAVAMEDASLTTKGVVKLSSAVDSTSESLAATPKAVKAANDNANSRVPSNRKVNGKALTADITLTPKDIGTLNSITMSFSGGAGWFKLATVTMPQASSIVYIALIGGAGYNVGSPHQAGISELVLRAGNGNPKGITGALWKRTAVGLTNFAWINTSGDTYDIYVEIGNYATSVNIHWDCTANATVSIYTSPTYSASKPSSVTDGVVYTMYSTHQKPTPLDIGALPTTGGTVSGPLSVTGGITGTLNGNASTATKLQTARSIGGVGFDGSANINLPGVNTTGNQNTTGNAATATKLQTARTIGGVSFDGTANINLPGVNTAGNQSTTGNAATATKLQTARTINGVKFDGSADITLTPANLDVYSKSEIDNKKGMRKYTFSAPANAVSGKWYPIVFRRSRGSTDELASRVVITTGSSVGGYAMNNCEFNGFVMPGGWSDRGSYAAGFFSIYSTTERAIHSIISSVKDDDLCSVFYVEARAFPIKIFAEEGLNVIVPTADYAVGQTTYKWGATDPLSESTNAQIILDFKNGRGYYCSHPFISSLSGNAATATKLQTARTIGGVAFDGSANINLPGVNTAGNQNTTGNAATATKLQTARNINGVKFDGSGDININTLVSRGQVTALSGSTQGTAGIQMYEAYSNNYPTSFGNVLHMKGASAAGEGELLIGWSGTSGAHAPVFIRSRRDVTDAAWSAWAQVYTTAHKPTAKDVGALPSGGGTLSGALTLSMVAPSVQLRGQGTDTRQYIMAYRTDGATSWYVGKANNGSDSAMLWNYTGANGIELAADGNVRINAKGKQFTFANNGNLGLVASLDQSSVPQGTYHQVALNTGTVGGKSYLRKFRGGNTDTIWHETVQGGFLRWATGNADEQEELSISTGYGVRARGEITSLSANGLRVAYGNYGFFIRNDGGTTYFLLTASGDKFGSWNALRPMYINNASGAVTMGNGLSLAGGLNVTSGNIRIPTSSTSWIDMRNNAALSNSSAVATSSASAIIRQEHADRHYFVGGLGNSQFGFYMINKSRTANGTDANAYLQNDGTWVCGGNGSFNDVYIRSDRRSKRNIRKIDRALDKLEQIEGVLYEIQVCGRYEQSGGLIAQDVQNVQPELVTVDHNDQSGEPRLRLNYNGVIGMLVEAVKELREEVRELKAKM
ncbi:tail fiber domain-containing protein [Shigella sonnei]|nr:tail fiber domain-containing protein [Shigella sonnei]EKY4792478.1 tail fiber domain-containing protein [Escherichia coli]EKK9768611.1 tail fiber domain-containing protein [Shigella sonnei]EKK9773018.1 tail fiber domain-containing protein [Shigella sonnei]EKK9777420.1 tail fiber domain-containing protein [Shigella sonnei]